jgi:hypothetical protein
MNSSGEKLNSIFPKSIYLTNSKYSILTVPSTFIDENNVSRLFDRGLAYFINMLYKKNTSPTVRLFISGLEKVNCPGTKSEILISLI